jgi:hypothetical protein
MFHRHFPQLRRPLSTEKLDEGCNATGKVCTKPCGRMFAARRHVERRGGQPKKYESMTKKRADHRYLSLCQKKWHHRRAGMRERRFSTKSPFQLRPTETNQMTETKERKMDDSAPKASTTTV